VLQFFSMGCFWIAEVAAEVANVKWRHNDKQG
jgi:hypothetical protein